MIPDALQKWTVVIVILLDAVYAQMMPMPMPLPYPMGGYGPMMMPAPPPPPMAMPIPVPVPIPIPYPESTTTSTTTSTDKTGGEAGNDGENNGLPIAIPVPVPQFVQIAFPGFDPDICKKDNNGKNGKNGKNDNRNKNCPPCPPCSCTPCTPSFFSYCSPCHLECRCKNGKENPSPQEPRAPQPLPGPAFPMPIPMPGPPPVVIVPFPPRFNNQQHQQESPSAECDSHPVSDSCSEEEKHSSCESGGGNRRKKKRKKGKSKKKKSKYDIYRRNYGFRKRSHGDGLVEPVLTYMSRNGEIKMKRRLSNDEANALLGESEPLHNVHLLAGEDSNNRPRVVVMSKPNMRSGHRRRQILLQDGSSQHLLGEGRKELVFRPPDNRKISNLSVSFQVAK